MSRVVLGTTMSLDGFIADQNGSVAHLYPDLEVLRSTDVLQESIRRTGAVVMGRRAYAMGDPDSYVGSYEYQVPIFVLAHALPARLPKQSEPLTSTFVTDGIESAIGQAQAAADEKDVTVVGGASTFQQCLAAGLADELQIDIMPVLPGEGLRLFEDLGSSPPKLEPIEVKEYLGRIELRYRVRRSDEG
jgi:dihydrofolate reductase